MTLARSWREKSRPFRIVTATTVTLTAAVLLLWLVRASLTEWAIERAIDGFGLGPSDVEITQVGLGRAEMKLVSSGAGTIEHIHVEYRIGRLLGGRVERMAIDGARLRFAWKDGKLSPAITPSEGPITLPVKRLDIANSSLTLDVDGQSIVAHLSGTATGDGVMGADMALTVRAPQGHLAGRVSGTMQPDGALNGTFSVAEGDVTIGTVRASGLTGALRLATTAAGLDKVDGTFAFEQISSGAGPLGPGRLSAALRQPQNLLEATIESTPVVMAIRADGANPSRGVPFSVDGTADAGFLAGLAGATQPAKGTLSIKASGTAPPAASLHAAFASELGDWLKHGAADGAIDGTASAVRIPGTVTIDDAGLSLHLSLKDGTLSLTTPKGIAISGMELDKDIAAADSMFAGNSNLSIAPAPGAPFLSIAPTEGRDVLTASAGISYETPSLFVRGAVGGNATLDPDQWLASARSAPATGDATLKAELALKLPEGRSLPAAELTASGTYDIGAASIKLVADSGALTVRNAHWGETLALPGTSSAALQPGASFNKDRATGAIEASAVLKPFAWNATMKRDGGEPGKVTVAAGRMALAMNEDGLAASLEKARIEMPDNGIAARGISATVNRRGGATDIKASIADLRGIGEPALFASLNANLDARIAGAKVAFTAAVNGAGKKIDLAVKGGHNLDSGKGSADITLKPLDLAGEGTIAALSPSLAKSVPSGTGTIAGKGKIQWGDSAGPGTLTVTLKDVGFAGPSLKASSFNGSLTLDSLAPMRSPAGQHVSGTLQLPTVNLVPVDATFHLEPGKLVVEKATAKIFDGTFSTENATLDAATGDGQVDLRVSDINLETAFAVLDLEQLKGSGRIGGMLPLRIQDGNVSVEKGHLESSVPGTLQVGVQVLADQLQTYGENVDMAFRALTDFHYNRMVIDAEKPFSGAGKALFRLEGNNPKVMEGQPFVFNITLETDFDYLTKLLLELSGAANTALGWGARELTKK